MSYTHLVSPKFALSIAAGPEWVKSISPPGPDAHAFVDASGQLQRGVLPPVAGLRAQHEQRIWRNRGAISDSVTFAASRVFARVWNGAVNLGYAQTEGLPTPGVPAYDFHTFIESVQIRAPWRAVSPPMPAIRWRISPCERRIDDRLVRRILPDAGFRV